MNPARLSTNEVIMALEDLSSTGSASLTDSVSHECSRGAESEMASVIIEQGTIHHDFIPTLLRNCSEKIRGATRVALENGCSRITAQTSRERLLVALNGIRGVKLAKI